MCRNIRTLHEFAPATTHGEVHAAALQHVRGAARTTGPSRAAQRYGDTPTAASVTAREAVAP